MKSFLKTIAILLPVLFIIGLGVVYFSINGILQRGVETLGPKLTDAPVTLDQVNLSLLSGKGQLRGLTIANPEDFKTPNALQLDKLAVEVDLQSLRTDTIRIRSIEVLEPAITVEGMDAKNLKQLEENVRRHTEELAGEKGDQKDPAKPGKKVIIEHIVVRNGKVNYSPAILMGKSIPIPLPDLHLNDVGEEEGGASIPQVVAKVFGLLDDAVIEALKGSAELITAGLKGVTDVAEKGVELAGDAAGAGAELVGDAAGAGVDLVEGAAGAGAAAVTDSAKLIGEGASKLAEGVGALIPGGGDKSDHETSEN